MHLTETQLNDFVDDVLAAARQRPEVEPVAIGPRRPHQHVPGVGRHRDGDAAERRLLVGTDLGDR